MRVRDVAMKAGVSAATVSNALNTKGGVSQDNSRRILSIARDMGYIQKRAPGAYRSHIRLVIFKRHGLVVMDTQFFAEIIAAMERQARRLGYELMITNIQMDKDPDYQDRIGNICHEDCAGIMLLATEMFLEDLALFTNTRAPLLVLDSLFVNEAFNCVVMDNFEAGYMATQRLIAMGHIRIEHITSSVRFNNMRYRRLGYESAMEDNKLPLPKDFLWHVTPTLEGAYRDMGQQLEARTKDMPTAFFAANDIIAVGCVRAMKEKGLKLPMDVSIIGMDDLAICQVANPPLSTIRVYREDIGSIAIIRLSQMMDKDTPRCIQKIQVGVTLVDRQSVRDLRDA